MNQDYEAQISREIARRKLNEGMNNECRKCLRIMNGCEGKTGLPCLGFLDVKYGEAEI